ncbi:hypothetical protein VNO77_41888 [Canavalia gladiata]|uniref:Secreted protein n=1 Tax=Canavalia gladiata TaxID=3824 RepID=A0AAN9PRX7_CANGL
MWLVQLVLPWRLWEWLARLRRLGSPHLDLLATLWVSSFGENNLSGDRTPATEDPTTLCNHLANPSLVQLAFQI